MASKIKVSDLSNLDTVKIGAGIGVIGSLVWCMTKRYSFSKTALMTLLVGGAGAYAGFQYDKVFNKE